MSKRKVRYARLDEDGKAIPLTKIVAHVQLSPSGKIYPHDPLYYTYEDTDPHKSK